MTCQHFCEALIKVAATDSALRQFTTNNRNQRAANYTSGVRDLSELISEVKVHSSSDDVIRKLVRYVDISQAGSSRGNNR